MDPKAGISLTNCYFGLQRRNSAKKSISKLTLAQVLIQGLEMMKMKKILLHALVLMVLTSLVSCSKYADGPMLSLRTKTQRVANQWKVAKAIENGADVTNDYNKFELNLDKGGGASLSVEYTFFGDAIKYTTEGSWVFVDGKDKISFDFENDDADGVYTILRLKEKEMWLNKDGSNLELHFVPQYN